MLVQREFAEYITWHSDRPRRLGVVSDVYDGHHWKNLFAADPKIVDAARKDGKVR
jgi:hypothetical protein